LRARADYLLSPSYNSAPEAKGNKFDEIMGIVVPLLTKYPDFKLYVTGHSLGGALSTLFAFKAASSGLPIQKPITCISVASPKVGDNSFRKAFQVRGVLRVEMIKSNIFSRLMY